MYTSAEQLNNNKLTPPNNENWTLLQHYKIENQLKKDHFKSNEIHNSIRQIGTKYVYGVGEESSRNTERTSGGHYTGGYGQVREWRGRRGRDVRPQRRIAPERYLNGSYPFQVKFTPDDLLNGKWSRYS